MFSNKTIKAKLFIIILSIIFIISTVLSIQSIITINNISDANIAKYKKEAYETKQKELENYVSVALNTIDTFIKEVQKLK